MERRCGDNVFYLRCDSSKVYKNRLRFSSETSQKSYAKIEHKVKLKSCANLLLHCSLLGTATDTVGAVFLSVFSV